MDNFSPLEACIASLVTMKVSRRHAGFQVSTSLIFPSPVMEVYGTFRNNLLNSSCGSNQETLQYLTLSSEVSRVPCLTYRFS